MVTRRKFGLHKNGLPCRFCYTTWRPRFSTNGGSRCFVSIFVGGPRWGAASKSKSTAVHAQQQAHAKWQRASELASQWVPVAAWPTRREHHLPVGVAMLIVGATPTSDFHEPVAIRRCGRCCSRPEKGMQSTGASGPCLTERCTTMFGSFVCPLFLFSAIVVCTHR